VNDERFPSLPTGRLVHAVSLVLRSEGVAEAELSVTFLEDAEIRGLNRSYLGHDRPTDVITFPLHDEGQPVLADLYIGADQAERQAAEWDVPLDEELVRLVVHGTLHALGHDHPEGGDRERSPFFERQEGLVRAIMAGGAS
jgi:rRNA maturation RNase YbeY